MKDAMKLKYAALAAVAIVLAAAGAQSAHAGAINWNFNALNGSPAQPGKSLLTQETYTQDGVTLTATSTRYTCLYVLCGWAGSTVDLYAKNGGTAAEQGLGLTNDPSGDHEITDPYGISISLSSGAFTSINIGSVQSGETWAVWGTNDSGWQKLGSGMGTQTSNPLVTFDLTGLSAHYSQLILTDPQQGNAYSSGWCNTSGSNNILLQGVSSTGEVPVSTPEPGALAMFTAGLLGCALFINRRRRAARQS